VRTPEHWRGPQCTAARMARPSPGGPSDTPTERASGPQEAASVSALLRYADLERRKHSRFGRYMRRYMDRRVLDAWRFFGQVVFWFGAWYRVGKLVPIGWGAIVVAAWASGLWRKPSN
jgi:hypothetical protein